MSKAVGAGSGPGSDCLDRLVLIVFVDFFRYGAWRSKIGSPVRLDDFRIVDALDEQPKKYGSFSRDILP